jgi:hypothetical protein
MIGLSMASNNIIKYSISINYFINDVLLLNNFI